MGHCLEGIAAKYMRTKFLKIVSNDCIPGYPDRNLPTLLIYKDTECKHNLVGILPYGGRMTPDGAYPMLLFVHHACAVSGSTKRNDPELVLQPSRTP